MEIFEKIKKVLLRPTEFFTEVKKEVGFGKAFKYLAVISLVYVVLLMIMMFFFSMALGVGYGSFISSMFAGFFIFILPIIIYCISLVGSFVGAGFVHLFAKMFGGKGDYSATYKVSVYSSTPTLLFGWINYVNLFVSIYSFYLYLKGLSILHDVSMGRAVLIAIIPGIIIVAIIFAFVIFFLFGMISQTAYTASITETIPYEYTGYAWQIMTKLPFVPK